MAKHEFPPDRFDNLEKGERRIGAHRAEQPGLRAWAVLLWALFSVIVLTTAGIFGTLLISGRVTLLPEIAATPSATPTLTPVVDTSLEVAILNGTGDPERLTTAEASITAAGWNSDLVSSGNASVSDFPETTVFYSDPAMKSAAAGLADVVGAVSIAESNAYAEYADLTVVIGLDSPIPTPSPTL